MTAVQLPHYLWSRIYLFYLQSYILPFIHKYRCYKSRRSYVITDSDSETCYLTNSLENPKYITTSYMHKKEYLGYFPERKYHHVRQEDVDAFRKYFDPIEL